MTSNVPAVPQPPQEPDRVVGKPVGVRRDQSLRHLAPVVLIGLLIGLCGIYAVAEAGLSFGVTTVAVTATMGLVAVGIVVPTFLWIDRYEVEPASLLWGAFLWGGFVATTASAFLNEAANEQFGTGGEGPAPVVVTFWGPLIEEGTKGIGLVLLLWLRRREIDGVVDGIVYGGIIGAGFAFIENIDYLSEGYQDGPRNLAGVFIVRVLVSPFGHSMFTVCMGIGIAFAALSPRWSVRVGAPLLGLAVAVGTHGIFNASGDVVELMTVGFPLFLAFLALLVWVRRREARTVAAGLQEYAAAGWLTQVDAAMLGSVRERSRARRRAKRVGGKALGRTMLEFQEAAGAVTMVRGKLNRGIVDPQLLREEQLLLTLLAQRRTEIAHQTARASGESDGPATTLAP